MDVEERIKNHVENNKVILFMKGTPQMPMCGFSSRTSAALKSCEREFAYVNVIQDSEVREKLPAFSDWPTFPQLFIDGELIGGCDIVMEMHESGDLKRMIQEAVPG